MKNKNHVMKCSKKLFFASLIFLLFIFAVADDFTITRYYGNYNGAIAIMASSVHSMPMTVIEKDIVADGMVQLPRY